MINILSSCTLIIVIVINSLPATFASGVINWNGNNWAMSCDFYGNDLSNVQISGEGCGGKCAATQECTHFTWTQWNGGTCWMKKGPVSKADAFPTNDPYMVCGVNYESQPSNGNIINILNRGSQTIKVGFFKNLGSFQPSFVAEKIVIISPGATQTVSLAQGWEGRLQKLTGAPADPATWAEIHFNAWQDMTFCDISLIRGFNGAMVFSSADGSLRTGFTNDLRPGAPSKFKVKDSNGYDVLQPTEPFTGGRNDELVAYYRGKVSQGNAYIIPDDHASSHGTTGKRMNLEIY
ncbi:unnamed protein product [Rotaria sordida]|uniref:Uncharacterized protein n=1 Tax=Rotaria sordida TaxID=392033 RepID=A0A814P141_9BILA|nr:unnamed protein product [Rotaria sordida]